MEFGDRLAELADADPSVAAILKEYSDIERVYRAALIASGQLPIQEPRSSNSADVTVSFRRGAVTTDL